MTIQRKRNGLQILRIEIDILEQIQVYFFLASQRQVIHGQYRDV